MNKLRWGLLAPGGIADAFANGLKQCGTGVLQAVASRSLERAEAFASRHGAPSAYGSYEAMLADPDVDAVYVATPHPLHLDWAVKSAQAGKHVLVEKPIGMTTLEAESAFEAARKSGVFMMEAFMYRCHPQTVRVHEMVASGVIGNVRSIEATFGFNCSFNAESRLWNRELGGGGILDVGGYVVSMARLVAGAAIGSRFADPVEMQAKVKRHPVTGVDCHASAQLKFASGIVAEVAVAIDTNLGSAVRLVGSKGEMILDEPWLCRRAGRQDGRVTLVSADGLRETIEIPFESLSYACEADVCGDAISKGLQEPSHPTAMTWADTLGNMRVLDAWRQA